MILTFKEKHWAWRGSFAERYVPIRAGFNWDERSKTWRTQDLVKVELIISMGCDVDETAESVIKKVKKRIADSEATDADIEIPAPAGEAYDPFQKAGILYASKRKNTLIGDQMGLGKTIQALGLINYLGMEVERVLIVCPASLKINWKRESEKWLVNHWDVGIAYGNKPFPENDIVIINYDILTKHNDMVRIRRWDLLVVDESHMAKTVGTQRTEAIFGAEGDGAIPADRRLYLTGTPLLNRPIELWPLLHSSSPQTWGTFNEFTRRYCNAQYRRYKVGSYTKGKWDYTGASNLTEMQTKLRTTIMLRRLKKDVYKEMPTLRRQLIELGESNEDLPKWIQKAKDLLKRSNKTGGYEDDVRNLADKVQVTFDTMAEVRHETALAKLPLAIPFIKNAVASSGKVVVFAHHHDVMDGIEEAFPGTCVRLDGKMSPTKKQESVDRFQEDPKINLFIGGIIPGGVGWTLTASSHVIFVELSWVPGDIDQAEKRCDRRGQLFSVLVQHLVLSGSLDARMAKGMISKANNIEQALDTSAFRWVNALAE